MKKEGLLFVTNLHFDKNGNGGQQRTYFLIKELAKHFDLIVISPYSEHDVALKGVDATFIENKGVKARKMLQTSVHGRIFSKMFGLITNMANKPNNLVVEYSKSKLKRQLNTFNHHKQYDQVRMIVFDTISTVVNLDKNYWKKRILNAHNFDFEIREYKLSEQLKDSGSSMIDLQEKLQDILTVKTFEFDIDTYFDVIWTCSESDIEKFKMYNPATNVVFECLPNGSDTETRQMQSFNNHYKNILFVGSLNYFPNTNGLQWFVDSIFKKLSKDFQLTIIGKSPKAEDFRFVESYGNVKLVGEVDYVAPYYAAHDVVIVPILEGSGTRLKILEAFSYGKLVLSTSKGIEGITAIDGEHYINFENFKDFDTKFVQNMESSRFETIRKQSRRLVENHYSWKGIISAYSKKLYGA